MRPCEEAAARAVGRRLHPFDEEPYFAARVSDRIQFDLHMLVPAGRVMDMQDMLRATRSQRAVARTRFTSLVAGTGVVMRDLVAATANDRFMRGERVAV